MHFLASEIHLEICWLKLNLFTISKYMFDWASLLATWISLFLGHNYLFFVIWASLLVLLFLSVLLIHLLLFIFCHFFLLSGWLHWLLFFFLLLLKMLLTFLMHEYNIHNMSFFSSSFSYYVSFDPVICIHVGGHLKHVFMLLTS